MNNETINTPVNGTSETVAVPAVLELRGGDVVPTLEATLTQLRDAGDVATAMEDSEYRVRVQALVAGLGGTLEDSAYDGLTVREAVTGQLVAASPEEVEDVVQRYFRGRLSAFLSAFRDRFHHVPRSTAGVSAVELRAFLAERARRKQS